VSLRRFLPSRPPRAQPDAELRIGPFALAAPAGHMLTQYQADHRLYDRLPAFLAARLGLGAIIDIGANVGDTAAAFACGDPKTIICAEPNQKFFPYLERNAELLRAAGHTVICEEVAIGPTGRGGGWITTASTARLSQEGEQAITFVSLDDLSRKHGLFEAGVSLVKCDVDGFDGAALSSGQELISRLRPLLYFENQVTGDQSASDLEALYAMLGENSYGAFGVFDNFGAPMMRTDSAAAVLDLIAYVRLQDDGLSTRSIHYIDVLAAADVSAFEALWSQYGDFARSRGLAP